MDDINTPSAIAVMEHFLSKTEGGEVSVWNVVMDAMDSVLGLNLLTLTRADLRIRSKGAVITEAEIEAALAARKDARAAKDFARSDAIRDDLIAKGVEVMDGDTLRWDWKLDV